jgi:hypothetical protein
VNNSGTLSTAALSSSNSCVLAPSKNFTIADLSDDLKDAPATDIGTRGASVVTGSKAKR